jgi:CrcB protein
MGAWVAAGGAFGAWTRWQLSALAPGPWTTVGINVVGSALLGALVVSPLAAREPWRTLLGVGVLGGFTTFSTFSVDVASRLREGAWGEAAALAAVSLLGGVAGALLGAAAARGW